MRLQNRVALVTGAAGGLGRGICEAFAREGADCVIVDNQPVAAGEKTAEAVRLLRRRALTLQADVGDEQAMRAAMDVAEREMGALDIVVANAGRGVGGAFLQTTKAELDEVMHTNVVGVYLTMRLGAERMARRRRGKIITISSIHGLGGSHDCSLYEASKAAVVSLTRSAAFDLGEYNIQVNSIAPGAVPVPNDPPPPEGSALREAWMRYTPLGRFGTPSDIGAAAVFLACSDSDWITGQALSVDGGVSAGILIPSKRHYS